MTARWDALVAIEPKLRALERDVRTAAVRHIRPDGDMTIDRLFYGRPGGFKQRLLLLVGWHAQRPELRSSTAYEVALTHLYGVLEEHEERVNGGRE